MSKRTKREKRPVAKIDFMPYGTAIKAERMKLKESRNKVGSEMFLSPRYIANIENKGQHLIQKAVILNNQNLLHILTSFASTV